MQVLAASCEPVFAMTGKEALLYLLNLNSFFPTFPTPAIVVVCFSSLIFFLYITKKLDLIRLCVIFFFSSLPLQWIQWYSVVPLIYNSHYIIILSRLDGFVRVSQHLTLVHYTWCALLLLRSCVIIQIY